MPDVVLILIGALLTLTGVWAVGRFAWRFRPPSMTMAVAAGAPLTSLMVFGLLTAKLAYGWVMAGALVVAIAVAVAGPKKRPEWHFHWLLIPLAAYGAFYLVHALAPEIQPDGTTYHLGLPAEWLRLHGFSSRVGFYEVLPLGMETLFLPAFWVGAHSAAKLVHFGFLVLTVPLMARVARQSGMNSGQGLAAASLYVMMPVTGITGTASYNDAALVFLTLAVFSLLLEDEATPLYWPLMMAGLAAGFCYAIKVTGILVVLGGLLWLAVRRRWSGVALFGCAALALIAPWVWRAWHMTGNPLAPLANSLFPNDYFHVSSERDLAQFLRSYALKRWTEIPWGLAVDGRAMQGLIGPAFLLAPVALLTLRRREGRLLVAAALLVGLAWPLNIGARFLLPTLAFVSLAMVFALPWRAMAGLAVCHAMLCWPWTVDSYVGADAWRLKGFPWRAALRLESEDSYLTRHFHEYELAKLVVGNLPKSEPLLDLYMLPYAYMPFVPAVPMPSASADNLAHTLNVPSGSFPEPLYALECRWQVEFVRAVRVRVEKSPPWVQWISEIELYRSGERVAPLKNWFVDAWPNPGDAWLAADGNRASRWFPDGPTATGMFVEVRFDRPAPLDEARAIAPNLTSRVRLEVYTQGVDGRWKKRSEGIEPRLLALRPLRRAATAFVKAQGYRWLVVRTLNTGYRQIGQSMLSLPDAWGLELVAKTGDAALFRLR